MEKLLTSYLFTYKNCPLPTVGALVLQPGTAGSVHGDKIMQAPAPSIQFVSKEINADELLQYISAKKNIDIQQASDQLSNYCDRLQQMQPYEEISFGSAGSFSLNEEGQLHFKASALPTTFLPAITAERVIHPDASHNMLVGDTETNTTAMAELLDNDNNRRRPKWLWAAIILGVAGLLAVTIYIMNRQPGNAFGNAGTVDASEAPSTYQPSGK